MALQIVDREQELMSTAGLQTIGGGGGLGRGGLDRELRIVPSKHNSCASEQLILVALELSLRRQLILVALDWSLNRQKHVGCPQLMPLCLL